jgi:hypothetical protein
MKRFIIVAFTLLLGGGSFATPNRGIDGNKMNAKSKSGKPVFFTGTRNFYSSIRSLSYLDSTATLGIFIPDTKNIHARALKDFQTRFGDSTQASWYSEGNGYSSYFMKDGYSDRAYYNKNGRWKYTLIYFDQNKFPEHLKKIVKSSYGSLNIDIVVEVQTNYGTAYMIYLGNKSRIRVIRMDTEGEMETITDLARG